MSKKPVCREKHTARWNAVLDLDDYRDDRFEPDLDELLHEGKVTVLRVPGHQGKVVSFEYPLPAYRHQVLIVSDAQEISYHVHSAYPVSGKSRAIPMRIKRFYPWSDLIEAEMLGQRETMDDAPSKSPALLRFFITNHAEIAGDVFPEDRVVIALSALLIGNEGLRDYRSFTEVKADDPDCRFKTEVRLTGEILSIDSVTDEEGECFHHLDVEGVFENDPDVRWTLPVLASARIFGTDKPNAGDPFSGLVWLHGRCETEGGLVP
jgi:hypothetical protein